MFKDVDRQTLEIIPISTIDKLVKDKNLLKKLSLFKEGDAFFNKKFTKEDYVNAISDYLFNQLALYNKNEYCNYLCDFLSEILMDDYGDNIEFLFNLKVVSEIYFLKDEFEGEDFINFINKIQKEFSAKKEEIKTVNQFINYYNITNDNSVVEKVLIDNKDSKDIYNFIIGNMRLFSKYFKQVDIETLMKFDIEKEDLEKLISSNAYIKAMLKKQCKNGKFNYITTILCKFGDDCLNLLNKIGIKEYNYNLLKPLFNGITDVSKIANFFLKNYLYIENISIHSMNALVSDRNLLDEIIKILRKESIQEYCNNNMPLEKYTKLFSIITAKKYSKKALKNKLSNNLEPDFCSYDFINNVLQLLYCNYDSIKVVLKSDVVSKFNIYMVLKLIDNLSLDNEFKRELMNLPSVRKIAAKDGIKLSIFDKFNNVFHLAKDSLYIDFKVNPTPDIIDAISIINPEIIQNLSYEELIKIFEYIYKEENEEYMYSEITIKLLFKTLAKHIAKNYETNFDVELFYENSNLYGYQQGKKIALNTLHFYRNMLENFEVFVTIFHEARHVKQEELMKSYPTYNQIIQIKDNYLSGIYYNDEAGNKTYDEKHLFNYKRNTLEVDARCNSNLHALKFMRMISPSFAETLEAGYFDEIENAVQNRNNYERKIESKGDVYTVSDLFHREKTPKQIAVICKKNPILLYEYNKDGTRKSIDTLVMDREYWIEKLKEKDYSKERLKSSKELQREYGIIKRSIALYDDLIDNATFISKDKIDLNLDYNEAFSNCLIALQIFLSIENTSYLQYVIDVLIDFNSYITYHGNIDIQRRYPKFSELMNHMIKFNLCDNYDGIFEIIKSLQLRKLEMLEGEKHYGS